MRRFVLLVCVLCAVLLPVLQCEAVPRYTITGLGSLTPYGAYVKDINNKGEVVGAASVDGVNSHAFIYSDGTMHDLGTLGGNTSCAVSVNESGYVVGTSNLYAPYVCQPRSAFLWKPETGMVNIGESLVEKWEVSEGLHISDSNIITLTPGFAGENPAVCTSGSDVTIIPELAGKQMSIFDINNHGAIIGNVLISNQWVRFYYENGGLHYQSDMGAPVVTQGFQQRMNDIGQVAGNRYDNVLGTFTYLWTVNGGWFDIPTIGTGWQNRSVFDINNRGQIIGECARSNPWQTRYYLYSDGTTYDFTQITGGMAGWTNLRPDAINDLGQIAGSGIFNGQSCVFLLTPVPEPSSLCTLLAGICSSVLIARKRKH